MSSRVAFLPKAAALGAIASGLIGGAVWSIDLHDRSDGDDLRWGVWHNPFMAFDPFCEPFLDISMWALLACAAAAGLGGLLLLAGNGWGARLVRWQAAVAIATNGAVVVAIALMASGVLLMDWTGEALALRLGSIAANLVLWWTMRSRAVAEWVRERSRTGATGRRR